MACEALASVWSPKAQKHIILESVFSHRRWRRSIILTVVRIRPLRIYSRPSGLMGPEKEGHGRDDGDRSRWQESLYNLSTHSPNAKLAETYRGSSSRTFGPPEFTRTSAVEGISTHISSHPPSIGLLSELRGFYILLEQGTSTVFWLLLRSNSRNLFAFETSAIVSSSQQPVAESKGISACRMESWTATAIPLYAQSDTLVMFTNILSLFRKRFCSNIKPFAATIIFTKKQNGCTGNQIVLKLAAAGLVVAKESLRCLLFKGENGGAEFSFLDPLAFNNLMTFCSKDEKTEKVPAVIPDLMARKVILDVFSYNVWMRSPAAASNIIGVEKALGKLNGNGRHK
ncbi:Pentatricopeptide repeat-containing protein [Nymphaea thermarum]|nr:Pentatricopeptide repeat-containing protein [Nymphaea thermarum]